MGKEEKPLKLSETVSKYKAEQVNTALGEYTENAQPELQVVCGEKNHFKAMNIVPK